MADGTYDETLVVSGGTLLRALDPNDPKPVINNSPAAADAVTIPPTGGSVDGFEIRSAFRAVFINGSSSITNNDFPTTTAPTSTHDVDVGGLTGSVLIAGNDFNDDGAGLQYGIFSNATSATTLTIQNNDFSGLATAIWLQAGDSSPLIADNDIAGIHTTNNAGILVYQGSPEIRNNTIDAPGAGTTLGVSLADTNGPSGATLSRNTIDGLGYGVSASGTSLPVTLSSDMITDSALYGLQSVQAAAGTGDVTATNVSIVYSLTSDIRVEDTALTLDSSILVNPIEVDGTTSTCSISFSGGTTTIGNATGCGSFQTAANPMFVNPLMGDFHLLPGSPMINAGNTLAPPPGALDFEGDSRALSSVPGCTLAAGRRDMGADEFRPATGVGCPPQTQPPAKKKCKKGRKLKKGKCVKKKRKKKR